MLELIYKCPDYAIVFKPFGTLSEENSGADSVPALLKKKLDEEGCPYTSVHIVHRLDRTTEGLMVCALNPSFAAQISKSISEGQLRKKYSAIVALPNDFLSQGEMRDYLYFDRKSGKTFVVKSNKHGSKEAVLKYSIGATGIYKDNNIALVDIELFTGRTHQIRAQFASRKAPLIGDGKYGSKINYKFASLRSVCLEFPYKESTVTYSINGLNLPN